MIIFAAHWAEGAEYAVSEQLGAQGYEKHSKHLQPDQPPLNSHSSEFT